MDKSKGEGDQVEKTQHRPYYLRLPRFVTDDDIGLGDVIKRVTSTVGIRPCGSCEQRAAVFNRWLVFTGRRPK